MIEKYHFGLITIDGKIYEHDVEVRPAGQVLAWQRERSHIIDANDIKRAVEEKPAILIIGTGEAGVAQVTEEARRAIERQGIKLIIENTGQAVKTFNVVNEAAREQAEKRNKAIGLFHLTC
jgi:hypothetical protein